MGVLSLLMGLVLREKTALGDAQCEDLGGQRMGGGEGESQLRCGALRLGVVSRKVNEAVLNGE